MRPVIKDLFTKMSYTVLVVVVLGFFINMFLLCSFIYDEPSSLSFGLLAKLSPSPLNDIDMSTITDYEDSIIVALDGINFGSQDLSAVYDFSHLSVIGSSAAMNRGLDTPLVK